MKKFSTSFIQCSLLGAAALAITFLLFCVTGCRIGKNTDKNTIQPKSGEVTICTTSTTASTSSSLTTSSTHTSTKTTMATTTTTETTQTIVQENIVPTEPVIQYIAVTTVYTPPVTEYVEPIANNADYSESDAILLAQLINKEASATYDGKVAVGSVVINRSNYYGQSISEVIYAPNQFSVIGYLGTYTDTDYQAAVQVLTTGSVNNAFYFDGCHPDHLNHFRDINNNYIGAW